MIERLERELKNINNEMRVKHYRIGTPDYIRLVCRMNRIEGALSIIRGYEV